MAYIDYLKERISYLRLLLAIDVVVAELLAAWVVFSSAVTPILGTCVSIAIVILVIGAIRGHYGMLRLIKRLGEGE